MIELATSYCHEREVTADYRQALHRVARSMQAAGITPLTLTDSVVNQWLAGLRQSPTTRSNYRRMGCTLSRYAAERGLLAGQYTGRIVKVKSRISPPIAWTSAELARLISAARAMPEYLRKGCPVSLFFEGFIRLLYETGVRFSDGLELKCRQLREGRLYVVQNKTGQPIGKILSHRLTEILTELSVLGGGQTFFRWALAERWVRIWFKRLCKSAKVNGTPKFLRRSGATYCEAKEPGSAKKFLGHLSEGLALKHYVDQTLLPDSCPTPLPIPE